MHFQLYEENVNEVVNSKFRLWMYQYINYISYCLWVELYSCVVRRSVILNSHEVGKSRIAIVYWTILFPFCGLIRIIHLF